MPTLSVADLVLPGARRKVFGSQIGGIKETQEMLDYSVEHGIYPEVEIIKADMVVFATPMYYFGISAQMKRVIDRFYAING